MNTDKPWILTPIIGFWNNGYWFGYWFWVLICGSWALILGIDFWIYWLNLLGIDLGILGTHSVSHTNTPSTPMSPPPRKLFTPEEVPGAEEETTRKGMCPRLPTNMGAWAEVFHIATFLWSKAGTRGLPVSHDCSWWDSMRLMAIIRQKAKSGNPWAVILAPQFKSTCPVFR